MCTLALFLKTVLSMNTLILRSLYSELDILSMNTLFMKTPVLIREYTSLIHELLSTHMNTGTLYS